MDDFHRTIAQIGFDAGDDLGLVLAGGYAISQHGLTSRPSRDVDFATVSPLPLPEVADRLAQAYQDAGYTVTIVEATSRMARMDVTDGTRACEVDLLKEAIGPPTRLTVGPVLAIDDAVGLKMRALYSRTMPRDIIDVRAAGAAGYSTLDLDGSAASIRLSSTPRSWQTVSVRSPNFRSRIHCLRAHRRHHREPPRMGPCLGARAAGQAGQ
ncbi:nucleotidyl transferase AbiEii/AbiGii toxin family protein [Winogradskya humida]|uniref:Nucleotidyltransferase AbiEii toxin of type IV toxin-antitoxin system n=1 Tax=Winogradskya humida TaxID=113566 RepID=A0ABQ3ZJI0_9ACTN|nr:nucleotidyl transferase AbiEii/AbiGii toxin family protein [Actinoplanes humidus]GIE18744.1 hypothetical protein Ahu01nite_018460 [Actinoplanes humidus]